MPGDEGEPEMDYRQKNRRQMNVIGCCKREGIQQPAMRTILPKRLQEPDRAHRAEGEQQPINPRLLREPDQVRLRSAQRQGNHPGRSTASECPHMPEPSQAEHDPPGGEKANSELPISRKGHPALQEQKIKRGARFFFKSHCPFQQHGHRQPGDPDGHRLIQPHTVER